MTTLSRRQFIQLGSAAAGAAALGSGLTTRFWGLDADAVEDPGTDGDRVVPTFCELCFWKCGVLAHVRDGRVTKIPGNPAHPLSRGRICPRWTGGTGLLYDPDRLKRPLLRRDRRGAQVFEEVSWETALDYVPERMRRIRDEHGPEAMALFSHGTGGFWLKQLLFAYGSANVAAPSCAQCRGPREVGFQLTFGTGLAREAARSRGVLPVGGRGRGRAPPRAPRASTGGPSSATASSFESRGRSTSRTGSRHGSARPRGRSSSIRPSSPEPASTRCPSTARPRNRRRGTSGCSSGVRRCTPSAAPPTTASSRRCMPRTSSGSMRASPASLASSRGSGSSSSTRTARPLWRSAALGPLFLASGISTGAALLLLFRLDAGEQHILVRWDVTAIGAELLLLALCLVGLSTGGRSAQLAASAFLGGPWTAVFWTVVVGAGLLVPLALEAVELRRRFRPTAVAPALILLGGMSLRWVLLLAGQGLHGPS